MTDLPAALDGVRNLRQETVLARKRLQTVAVKLRNGSRCESTISSIDATITTLESMLAAAAVVELFLEQIPAPTSPPRA